MNVQELNSRFGIGTQLRFVEESHDLVVAEIENNLASAKICLLGAYLLTWRPRSTSIPVVWLSEHTNLAQSKAIRGGVPICWPWFGEHESDRSFPRHGFARAVPWQIIETATEPDGATRLELKLLDSPQAQQQWPHACELKLTIIIGETLKMQLATTNTGKEAFVIGEAMHTYFQISDIEKVSVTGLANTEYLDKVEDFARKPQAGDITFAGETDRVYVDTEATCTIEDAGLKRRITIAKSGSRSTVVWTPWKEKADLLGDMGSNEGWRRAVCVESANASDNVVTVAPGATHLFTVKYSTEAL
jgi:glucose-6-phosphate 1-epimerase